MSTSLADVEIEDDEDEKIANTQIIAELKESLQRVEQANEQYRKQLDQMKARLDDATNQLTVAEEKEFQSKTEMDRLNAQLKDTARQRRELEMAHESETRLIMQGQQALIARENEMQNTIVRLNTTLREKGLEKAHASRAGELVLPFLE
jgi:chromosome segregation ATPase